MVLMALVAGSLVSVLAVNPLPAQAGGTGTALGPNGQHRRPFYIYAHNPNEITNSEDDVLRALDAGANGLEPDVMVFNDSATVEGDVTDHINTHRGPSGMFMYHDPVAITSRVPNTVESWFGSDSTATDWWRSVAGRIVNDHKNVAAIALDIKSRTVGRLNTGPLLHGVVADFQNTLAAHGVPLEQQPWIIYSVGSVDDANNLFTKGDFIPLLGPKEGIMIDGGGSAPDITTRFLLSKGAARIGYGAGSLLWDIGGAPSVLANIEQASAQNMGFDRDGIADPIAIPYSFDVSSVADMNRFIDAGADGEIPDSPWTIKQVYTLTVSEIATLSGIVSARTDVFLATGADDPFKNQKTEGYALRIHTTDKLFAGTSAHLTFTLKGCLGSSSVTIDANYQGEFGQADVNRVTIPSKDLGSLQSLTLSNDGAGTGSGWNADDIQLVSNRYGIALVDLPISPLEVDQGSDQTIGLSGQGSGCNVRPAYDTTTVVSSSQNPSMSGQPVTFTAQVSTGDPSKPLGGGTVDFFVGSSDLGASPVTLGSAGTATASFTTTRLPASANHQNLIERGVRRVRGSCRSLPGRVEWVNQPSQPGGRRWPDHCLHLDSTERESQRPHLPGGGDGDLRPPRYLVAARDLVGLRAGGADVAVDGFVHRARDLCHHRRTGRQQPVHGGSPCLPELSRGDRGHGRPDDHLHLDAAHRRPSGRLLHCIGDRGRIGQTRIPGGQGCVQRFGVRPPNHLPADRWRLPNLRSPGQRQWLRRGRLGTGRCHSCHP